MSFAQTGKHLTTAQVVALSGATYRQLDYWSRCGYLGSRAARPKGSGNERAWTLREADLVRRIVSLLDAGFTVEKAVEVARSRLTVHLLGPGIVLTLAAKKGKRTANGRADLTVVSS